MNKNTIARLQCKAVTGAANNQLAEPDDAGRLEERQILYAPDFICNSGGIIGVILVLSLFEVALIGVSALIGASLVVQALNLSPAVAGLLFVILLIVGIVIQAKTLSEKS